jgi:hypothetical protein
LAEQQAHDVKQHPGAGLAKPGPSLPQCPGCRPRLVLDLFREGRLDHEYRTESFAQNGQSDTAQQEPTERRMSASCSEETACEFGPKVARIVALISVPLEWLPLAGHGLSKNPPP